MLVGVICTTTDIIFIVNSQRWLLHRLLIPAILEQIRYLLNTQKVKGECYPTSSFEPIITVGFA